jgi:hypothetical protein
MVGLPGVVLGLLDLTTALVGVPFNVLDNDL